MERFVIHLKESIRANEEQQLSTDKLVKLLPCVLLSFVCVGPVRSQTACNYLKSTFFIVNFYTVNKRVHQSSSVRLEFQCARGAVWEPAPLALQLQGDFYIVYFNI